MSSKALLVVAVLAGCAGALAGTATRTNPILLAGQSVAAVIVMEAFRRLDLPRTRLFAAGEFVALGLVATVGFLSDAPADAVVGLIMTLVVWLLAAITATDLDSVAEPTDLVDGIGGATRRLNTRFALVGIAGGLLVVASQGSFRLPSSPRGLTNVFSGPFVAYWLVGLAGLAAVHRQRLFGRWGRDGALVDGDVAVRWRRVVVVSLGLLVLGGVGWWWLGRPALASAHHGVAWLVRAGAGALARLRGDTPPGVPQGNGTEAVAPPPETINPIQPVGERWDFILVIFAALIFGSVFVFFGRGRRRNDKRGASGMWRRIARQILQALFDLVKGLVRLLLGLRWATRQKSLTPPPLDPLPRSQRAWNPDDPIRRRVALAFRQQVTIATQQVRAPRGSETPLEYSARVEPDPAFTELAALYSEARYSPHPMKVDAAEDAEDLHRRLVLAWARRV